MRSKIRRFREEQAQREEAAHLALAGPAIVARHDFIEARATRGAARILQLLAQGRFAEAEAQMNIPGWEPAEAHEEAARDDGDERMSYAGGEDHDYAERSE